MSLEALGSNVFAVFSNGGYWFSRPVRALLQRFANAIIRYFWFRI